jgi:16S rRNA (cytosine1402-N4)-methyltransferase
VADEQDSGKGDGRPDNDDNGHGPSAAAHVPVLLDEALAWLEPRPGQVVVDGTLGGGGHALALADRVGPSGLVIALDRDPLAIERGARRLAGRPVRLAQANFCDLAEVLNQLRIERVDAVLLDLGLSSDQLADRERGFSFSSDGPLDLRFDPDEGQPAWRLIERLREKTLADLIFTYGEERFSRRIAKAMVERRQQGPLRIASDVAELVRRCYPSSARHGRIDPATRTFQALRIAVNDELKSLDVALRRTPDCVRAGGRLAVISFHSLEDRRVKEAFRDDPRYEVLTRRPITPGDAELARNPRARSAKLRVARILAQDV